MKTINFSGKMAIVAICLCISNFSISQATIDTPAALKNACETSPGNIVNLSQSIKVASPTIQFTPTTINCPCTLVITNESKVEFEQANIQFTGALSIQSTGKGKVVSVNSTISAPSISMNLGGESSFISFSQSQLNSSGGNLTMTLGRKANLELYGRYNNTNTNSISATGAVNITAGDQFTGSIVDMSVSANQGISVRPTGFESFLKLEKAFLRSSNGAANIIAQGINTKMEVIESGFLYKHKQI